ncbi:MAG: aromatic ring-hydroxylating dioxygenase subunit alpha [Myxococcota bacterium]
MSLPEPGRFSTTGPAAYWYPALRADEIGSAPKAFRRFDTPLVAFRDAFGRAAVLVDRCPHRNTPLSLGRCVRGELECAYHGWRFDGDGRCTAVPALIGPADTPARRASAIPTLESQGMVWIWMHDSEPSGLPYEIPGVGVEAYEVIRYEAGFEATLYATAENILDVPHTSFLHKGLFRVAGHRNRVTVKVARRQDRAEAEFIGEPRPAGVIGSLLAPGGGELRHVDRFIMPGIAQVEYGLGDDSHVIVTNLLVPVRPFETQMFTVVALRLPVATSIVRRIAEPVARRIVEQDARILSALTGTTRAFGGERFVSTPVDLLAPAILKLLRWGEQGSVPDVPDDVREVEMDI